MNGLPPKPSRGGTNKPNNIGSPIVINRYFLDDNSFSLKTTDVLYPSIQKFQYSTSAEEQLAILKSIIETEKSSIHDGVIMFLAIVFYEAPAKHPMKCILSRFITKSTTIQESFTNCLTLHIVSDIGKHGNPQDFSYYSGKVPKILMCIENFPCGARAVEAIGVDRLNRLFFEYFLCRSQLRQSLSPTKKNEMFSLEHMILRVIVHVIQKLYIKEGGYKCRPRGTIQFNGFINIMYCVNILITDEEVPMDTKSLSGILILASENIRINTWDAWKYLLERTLSCGKAPKADNNDVFRVLSHKIGRLAVCSAIATSVPMELLQEELSTGTPAVLVLVEQLLSYADGSASEPAVTVAVTRALVQLSRSMGLVPADQAGERMVAVLLPFVWSHLEYHLDSVRHLAVQILVACLQYCAALDKRDLSGPLESLLRSVRALGEARSFYWAVSRAVPALGAARVLTDLCDVRALLHAAAAPHLQAAASAAISSLVAGGACSGLHTSEVFERWVCPALHSAPALLAVLPAAVAAHPALPQYIAEHARGRAALACVRAAPACRACLTHRTLRAAAVHHDDETRLVALSLVAECGRTTASVSPAELDSVLWFLRYNLNAPRPAFRTALLANINKLLKRLEASERSLRRRGEEAPHYGLFVERLRALCFAAALRGASHGRRSAALQLLAAAHSVLPALSRTWKEEYVQTLLQHLDDNYDSNKEHALQVLLHCPAELLESCTGELSLRGVVRGARSPRAAGGAAAAVKLQLLLARLPHRVLPHTHDINRVRDESLRAQYAALHALLLQLREVGGSAGGGAAGTLRCVADVLQRDTGVAHWHGLPWSWLAAELAEECVRACEHAEPVVANQAPEGYLPSFPDGCAEAGAGEGAGEAGAASAQAALVHAWRSVKEASAVMGLLAARSPPGAGAGAAHYSFQCGEYLAGLLTRALHRGAVDQAALGLAAVAHHCWSTEARAHWPRVWARELVALAARGAAHATRRGAGLPAALQALLSAEVTATGRAECFTECMDELVALASARPSPGPGASPPCVEGGARRALAANILRALFRHTTLEKASLTHVGAGLRLALQGFEAAAWPERTAMSLLFCALVVRVFGVTRARGPHVPARNTMPAALFFKWYPGIYDLMLSKLVEFEPRSAAGPAVLPVLLLLARLYPSAVEGAASSLKVSAFVPLVQRCACASELRIRRAAARALPSLLPPAQHEPYMWRVWAAVCAPAPAPALLHNHWHGGLLTLASLLERAPAPAGPSHTSPEPPGPRLSHSMAALSQAAGPRPCYVVAREYVNVLNLLIWKFPAMIPKETWSCAVQHVHDAVFPARAWGEGGEGGAGPDRDLCLADCTLLYYILLHKEKQFDRILPLVNRTLLHPTYEVVLSTLDYLLIQRGAHTDTELCNFRQHLLTLRDDTIFKNSSDYMIVLNKLSECLHDAGRYQECRLKCLKLLTLENNTQRLVLNESPPPSPTSDPEVWLARKLIQEIQESHEDVRHLYLKSLLNLAKEKHEELHKDEMCFIDIYQVMYECSSAENSCDCRTVVVEYFESVPGWGLMDPSTLRPDLEFMLCACAVSTLVTLLEDDDDVVRQRACDVVGAVTWPRAPLPEDAEADDAPIGDVCVEDAASLAVLCRAARDNAPDGLIASAGGEALRAHAASAHGAPLLLLLALLDFRAEVRCTDLATDQCRVFDQSERYNIFLEESVWTAACADKIIQIDANKDSDLIELALSTIRDQKYSNAFWKLCNRNVRLFTRIAKGDLLTDDTVNPKIEILYKKLRG